jgi:hypothetical protein
MNIPTSLPFNCSSGTNIRLVHHTHDAAPHLILTAHHRNCRAHIVKIPLASPSAHHFLTPHLRKISCKHLSCNAIQPSFGQSGYSSRISLIALVVTITDFVGLGVARLACVPYLSRLLSADP